MEGEFMIKSKATQQTYVRSDHVAEQQVPYKQAHRKISALGPKKPDKKL